jgi:ABC-type branched-subunit amino acid transport system ATPase component
MLQVDSVYKKFGGVIALDNVSYSLDGKNIAGIIGPNGSGKTTLLNVISGLVKPDRGKGVI